MTLTKYFQTFLALLAGLTLIPSSSSQTYQVLYSFTGGSDGAVPFGQLILDPAGNLYGTTAGFQAGTTMGSIFKITRSGKFKLLHNFGAGGIGGSAPDAGLVRDQDGNFFGTTTSGGSSDHGTIFELNNKGAFNVLYSFAQGLDGADPIAPLTIGPSGILYGTTALGGTASCNENRGVGCGTVFKFDLTTGKEKVIKRFSSSRKYGDIPVAGLLLDSAGNLYGTNSSGGSAGNGTVFKLDSAGNETILHSFQSQSDGALPGSELIQDASGNFYGTTTDGDSPHEGGGTIFKIDPQGNETVFFAFGFFTGITPTSGTLVDSAGNFYGTTYHGSIVNDACSDGCGVVYKIDSTGTETVLYSFTGGTDGYGPYDLIMDSAGNLYGTTAYGGTVNSNCPVGCGVVFKITP